MSKILDSKPFDFRYGAVSKFRQKMKKSHEARNHILGTKSFDNIDHQIDSNEEGNR